MFGIKNRIVLWQEEGLCNEIGFTCGVIFVESDMHGAYIYLSLELSMGLDGGFGRVLALVRLDFGDDKNSDILRILV